MVPRLSIITVNYNGLADTLALLTSLRQHVTCDMEMIVVDNGSQQDDTVAIRNHFPDDPRLVLIRSERNLGFAGGNNLGIRAAKAPYILLLNNDTYIEESGLERLIESLESHPQAGAVSPKIRFAASPQAIQFAGYTPLSRITLRNALIGYGELERGAYQTPHTTPFCHGAALLVKREVIERVGEMPECFFLYYEELDWCTRMTQAGYELWYEPSVTVFHKESQSTGQQSPLRTYYLTRNRLLYARRNLRPVDRTFSILYQCCIALPKAYLCFLLQGDRQSMAAVIRGTVDFFNTSWK